MRQLSLFEEFLKEEKETHWPLLESNCGPRTIYDGREVINFSSFGYLGLANHQRVIDATRAALDKYGGDASAPRHSGGNTYLHQLLEERLAEFKRVDAVLLFPTDVSAAFSLFTFMLSSRDLVLMDENSNKKIYKLVGTNLRVFPHKDVNAARTILESTSESNKRIFLGESIFEAEGDIFPYHEFTDLIKSQKMVLAVDDTNGMGVLGRNGRGVADHFNLYGQIDIDIGSLSRAFASQVGYIGGVKALITYLIEHSPFFSMPTAPSPLAVASALAGLEIVKENHGLIERLWQNAKYFRASLKQLGLNTGDSQTPIIPIFVSDESVATIFSNRLLERGCYIPYLVPPFVPQGKARLRAIITAVHTREELNRTLDNIETVGRELDTIR